MSLLCRQSTKKLAQISSCLLRKPLNVSYPIETSIGVVNKRYFLKNSNADADNSEPVQFTNSEASKWRAEYSRSGTKDDDSPPSQPYIVVASLAAFMIYFFILREENDIDIKIGGGGFSSTFEYLEYIQLKAMIEQNIKDGVESNVEDLDKLKRLEKLQTLPAKL